MRHVQSGALGPEGTDVDPWDLGHPLSFVSLLAKWHENRTMSQAAGRIDGHLPISMPFPWYTLSFNCRDSCVLHWAINSTRAGRGLHHCQMPCAWDCAEYVVGARGVLRTAEMNGGIKYLECPTQHLKHNRNSSTRVATLALLIKINLLIFPTPCCALVRRGP